SKPSFAHKALSRDRLHSSHYQLVASLFRVSLVADPGCQCGCLEQDLNHVIWQCPLYDSGRAGMMHRLCKVGLSLPYSTYRRLSE
ncbi:hypothetical protein WH47_03103, partial [Habropoda laboriosa]